MRRPLVAGNWKMNKTSREAAALVEAFVRAIGFWDSCDIAVCPPYLSIPSVKGLLKGTNIEVGAQDVFWKDTGAYTGNVSARMLKDAGVEFCIVGHSETRGRFGKLEVPESTLSYFSETDETVNLKLGALLFCDICPILCVGETIQEREAEKTDEIIRGQLEKALKGLDPAELRRLVVAYEPVWAIGTGKTCDTDEAQRVCAMIRAALGEIGPETRVLYGGSVRAANARELFTQPDIDGGLVGGASLEPQEFKDIVMAAR